MRQFLVLSLTAPLLALGSPTPAQETLVPDSPDTDTSTDSSVPRCAPLPSAPEDGGTPSQSLWESLFDDSDPVEPVPDSAQDPGFPSRRPSTRSRFWSTPSPRAVIDPWEVLHEEMGRMKQWHDEVFEEMDRQMDLLNGGIPGAGVQTFSFGSAGGAIVDKGDHYEIALTISGLDRSTTAVCIEGNQLVLECVCRQSASQADPSGRSRSQSSFTNNLQRRWTLPADVDHGAVEAKQDENSLRIMLPKLPGGQATIEVPIR
jgi:HSP20 family molecular chaperone IbpA